MFIVKEQTSSASIRDVICLPRMINHLETGNIIVGIIFELTKIAL